MNVRTGATLVSLPVYTSIVTVASSPGRSPAVPANGGVESLVNCPPGGNVNDTGGAADVGASGCQTGWRGMPPAKPPVEMSERLVPSASINWMWSLGFPGDEPTNTRWARTGDHAGSPAHTTVAT